MTEAVAAEDERAPGLPDSPYVGLVPYGEEDAGFFFGRDDETRIVSGNLRASDLTLLYGASGVGKTSLLRAGVIHDLHERAHRTELVLSERPPFAVAAFSSWRDGPLPALMETIREAAVDIGGGTEVAAWQPGASVTDTLYAWTERVRTLLVVLDQFEDYFLYHPDEAGPGTFAGELPRIVNDPNLRVHVLLSIREDALAKLDRFKGSIPRLFANYVRIEHLSRAAARAAIEGPLDEWNRRQPGSEPYLLGPGLADTVIDATATGGVTFVRNGDRPETATPDSERVEAPYLQLVMERLWRDAAAEGSHDLTVERLDRLGGPQQIVENHLLDALGSLSSGEQEVAADIFRFLVSSSKTKIAHPATDLEEWTGLGDSAVEPVLDKLCRGETGRILRRVPPPPTGNGDTRYELYHDVLAEPILEWRREYEQDQRRRALRRRVVRIGGGVLLLVAVISGLGLWALVQRNEARSATRSAASLALAAAANDRLRGGRVDEALLLGLEGYRESPSADAAGALVAALAAARQSGAAMILRGQPRGVRAIDWSPDGARLATAGFDGTVRFWDVEEGEPLGEARSGHEEEIWSVAYSSDGTTLASAGHEGTVRLWDAESGTPGDVLEAPEGGLVASVALSPDGRVLASAGEPGAIQLWDVQTREPLGPPLAGHRNRVVGLTFSPDGRTLASASYDGAIRFWDVRSREPAGTIEDAHDGGVLAIAWSPDGGRLASSGTDGVVNVWDVRSRRSVVAPFGPGKGDVWGLDWSPDGRLIASTQLREVRLWNAATGEPAGVPLRGHADRLVAVAFAPNGRRLASTGYDGTVRVWPTPRPRALGGSLGRHSDQVRAVAYRPDGLQLASADYSGEIRLWNLPSRKQHALLEDERTTSLEDVAWHPDGRLLAASGDSILIWDVDSGDAPVSLAGHEGTVYAVAWSPDGSRLVSGGADRTIRIWDVSSGLALGEPLRGHTETVWNVAWSPDGRTLASVGFDGTLRFWDAERRVALETLRLEGGDAGVAVAFSPDGRTLATVSAKGLVQLWDVAKRTPLGEPLAGSALFGTSVAFSPDGSKLVSSTQDGIVQLWDVEGRRALVSDLQVSRAPIYSAQFAPDGLSFATGGGDDVVRLWEGILWRDPADLEAQVCGLVIGNVSESEWSQLVPGLPYRETCP